MVLTATSLFYLRKCFPYDGGGSRETSGRVIRKDSEEEDTSLRMSNLLVWLSPQRREKDEQ